MPVSLGRRLRRIGIPEKQHRTADWTPAIHSQTYKEEAVDLINAARIKRDIAFIKHEKPSREHRRSRSRIKRGREVAAPVKGKR